MIEKLTTLEANNKSNYLEKEKAKLKVDFNNKLDSLADQFRKKVAQLKEGFTKQMVRTKNKYNSEINKLKSLINVPV